MAQVHIFRGSLPMLGLLAELDRTCFAEPWPDLARFLRLPAAGLDAGLFSLADAGPLEVPLALGLGLQEEDGGVRLVASLLLVTREHLGLIERVAVHPDHRRKGYATGLLAAAALEGRKIGLRVWGAELREDDLASQQFFRALGFAALPPTDASRGWFGDRDAVVMTRTV